MAPTSLVAVETWLYNCGAKPMRIGVDLGGSKIAAIVMEQNGTISQQLRTPTPQGDYQATLLAIKDLVLTLESQTTTPTPHPVGVGIPGAVSKVTGRIKNANSLCLIGEDLQGDLSRLLARPIRLANDADCFCLSEASDGAGKDATIVFGVILGTGVGGGIAFNKQLLQGPNSITGEWGHNSLPWPTPAELPGPQCYCGKTGCIESFLSGPGLSNSYFAQTRKMASGEEIAQLDLDGNSEANRVLQLYEKRLARALAAVINVIDPHVIVLGGGLSNIKRLYKNIPMLLPDHVFSDQVKTTILPARYGDASGVRGAAWLWPR